MSNPQEKKSKRVSFKLDEGYTPLELTFEVRGNDHDGYCSGAEANSEKDELIAVGYFYGLYKLPQRGKLFSKGGVLKSKYINTAVLDYANYGCTSGGSGYCTGMHQEYTLVSIKKCGGYRRARCDITDPFNSEHPAYTAREYISQVRDILDMEEGDIDLPDKLFKF